MTVWLTWLVLASYVCTLFLCSVQHYNIKLLSTALLLLTSLQLIAQREAKLQEPTLHPLRRIHLEWDVRGLKEDVKRWKQTLDVINQKLVIDT